MRLTVAARTDVGVVRAGNEDNFHSSFDSTGGLFIVADGMGGHAAGEVASEMAVQIIANDLKNIRSEPLDTMSVAIADALRHANELIHARTLVELDKQGMGTTASALLISHGRYIIGQIGDSRVYHVRNGELKQLTKDHSYVQEQVDAGFLTLEQARYHPYSNVITRCVGAGEDVEADVFEGELETGDIYLVTSDGLTGMVDDRRLQQLLTSRATPDRMVGALISEANGRGGLDNITAIIVQVDELDAPASNAPPGADE